MARANPRYDRINRYLKQEFPWQLDFYYIDTFNNSKLFQFYTNWLLVSSSVEVAFSLIVNLHTVIDYQQMKQIMIELKEEQSKIYSVYQYMWLSYQKRNNKAEALYCDSSTFKRNCDKMCKLILKKIYELN